MQTQGITIMFFTVHDSQAGAIWQAYDDVMVLYDMSQTFLFTFRANGEAHGLRLTEVHVHQLAANEPSVAEDAYKRSWYGTEESLLPMLASLGFPAHEIGGVVAALGSHHGTDRKLAVTPDQLHEAGFQQAV